MKKVIFVFVIVIFVFIFLFARPSSAAELEGCENCHGAIKSIPSYNLTKDCLTCHHTHGMRKGCCQPKSRDPEKVHKLHENPARKVSNTEECIRCHRSSISCTACHNSHENINDTNATVCTDCHGKLPQPRGHENFRESISKYKHDWTSCETCHVSPYKNPLTGKYEFKLRFGDLLTVDIDNSNELCKICHSPQYERMQEGRHGTPNDKCVGCHNPHTTKSSGPGAIIASEEPPINISTRIGSTKEWIFENVPILNNPVALIIVTMIIVAMVAEYILSRYEEGKKMAYNMIKVHGGEDVLKTLEIRLKSQNIDEINKTLEEYGINILGMTMKKEEDKEEYKYVVFVDTGKLIMDEKREKDLIDEILSKSDVKSAELTEKYEL